MPIQLKNYWCQLVNNQRTIVNNFALTKKLIINNIIECIFLSQGRHYDSFPDFTPSSDANWCLTDSQQQLFVTKIGIILDNLKKATIHVAK